MSEFFYGDTIAENLKSQYQTNRAVREGLEAQREEAAQRHLGEEQWLFGVGKRFGQRRRKKEIEDLLSQVEFRDNVEGDIFRACFVNMELIRESAERREELVRGGKLSPSQAASENDEFIGSLYREHLDEKARNHEEALAISAAVEHDFLTPTEAESPQVDEILEERRREEREKKERFWQEGADLFFGHLAFLRRTDFLPEVDGESGRAIVFTPISAISDPMNAHMARVSSHWSVQKAAPDPGMYGKYGTGNLIVVDGQALVAENGVPYNLFPNDTYWLHDLALPKGTVIFSAQELPDALAGQYGEAGISIVRVDKGRDLSEVANAFVSSQGYNQELSNYMNEEVAKACRALAAKEGIRFGTAEGDDTDDATGILAQIVTYLQELRNGEQPSPSRIDGMIGGLTSDLATSDREKVSSVSRKIKLLRASCQDGDRQAEPYRQYLRIEVREWYKLLVGLLEGKGGGEEAPYQRQLEKVRETLGGLMEQIEIDIGEVD